MSTDKTNNFSHIKFGFRGEGISYKLNGKEYEFNSTCFDGINICFDDLGVSNLNESQKTKMFVEIIQFVNEKENVKPTISYNIDEKNAELWKKLTVEFSSQIKDVDITNNEKANEAWYKSMKADLETGLAEMNIKGLKIKTVKDLDKHWNKIKFTKDGESNERVTFWDKLKAKLN
ncbi:hypothetical protein [Bizionia arctica]|uniref:Uncharacterized protein n=1 Tax=Bizionia arctica TaxID=1495645 RepID=A0A917GY06_9FLAO|nr:hypothetical protein [Bizionia arctica]GGG60733.1 hypothetical protein GCM10010976_34310 [Bizionia arctica]